MIPTAETGPDWLVIRDLMRARPQQVAHAKEILPAMALRATALSPASR
jgi:hypothetical protein